MYDPLLELIIELAEAETPVETEVTLIIGGMLVAGHVISEEKYMAHHPLTKAFMEVSSEDEDEVDADVAADPDEDADEEDDDEDFDDESAYVHLRDARCHAPGQAPSGNGRFYRIALSDVSGLSLAG